MFWTNPDRKLICGAEIVEWDIKSGNTSIMKEHRLIHPKTISELEKMTKQDRVVAVGKLQAKIKDLAKNLEKGFDNAVNSFIQNNQIERDYDIISIKRDAVFLCNVCVDTPYVGEYIKFVPKNMYHAYMNLSNKEVYFKHDGTVHVKGINDSLVPLHSEGINSLLKVVIEYLERMDFINLNIYLRDFAEAYKKRELPFDYYRNYDNESKFVLYVNGERILIESITEDMIDNIDIAYNYINVIMPLIELVIA